MQLDAQSLGKAVHVSLGRGVDGEGWQRNQARRGTNVADPARLAPEHAGKCPLRKARKSDHVDRHHRFDLRRFARFEGAEIAEAGVVNKNVGREVGGIEFGQELGDGVFLGEIGSVNFDAYGRAFQPRLQLLEPVEPPRGEDEMPHALGDELHGEFLAQTGGRAGDERRPVGEERFHAAI